MLSIPYLTKSKCAFSFSADSCIIDGKTNKHGTDRKTAWNKKKTSRQLQAEASREKLQQIVMDLCKTRTLDEIRIKDICEQAGMSLGNFYQYCSSKEDALIYSYKTKDDCWSRMRFEEIADPLERVKRIIATHLRSMTE